MKNLIAGTVFAGLFEGLFITLMIEGNASGRFDAMDNIGTCIFIGMVGFIYYVIIQQYVDGKKD